MTKQNKQGSYVRLDRRLYYGIHPLIVKPDIHEEIDHYIILTEWFETEGELENAHYYPIIDTTALTQEEMHEIVEYILALEGNIYIACKGGHGRSGMVASAVYGRKHNKTALQSLVYLQKQWTKQRNRKLIRPYIWRMGSPQTYDQKMAVINYLEDWRWNNWNELGGLDELVEN